MLRQSVSGHDSLAFPFLRSFETRARLEAIDNSNAWFWHSHKLCTEAYGSGYLLGTKTPSYAQLNVLCPNGSDELDLPLIRNAAEQLSSLVVETLVGDSTHGCHDDRYPSDGPEFGSSRPHFQREIRRRTRWVGLHGSSRLKFDANPHSKTISNSFIRSSNFCRCQQCRKTARYGRVQRYPYNDSEVTVRPLSRITSQYTLFWQDHFAELADDDEEDSVQERLRTRALQADGTEFLLQNSG
ncbi:hypothetical protein Moror_8937 [Moniliophthora roreri MCA 2997]|uniref:Uncharacterized protein n=1 Tax=Moniliophthora roreri (strain MCA 2997) TaxID=1381753 RepID=V2YMV4_MONRO|nr:hypothetical protein Moror_8937 [Moniliophthora roreri MCA 2997]